MCSSDLDRNKYFLSFDDGVKQTNLRKNEILSCKLFLPNDINEQQAISKIISEMDQEIEELEQKKDKYKMIKEGMMQQLLTGRIRLIPKNGKILPKNGKVYK